MVAALAVLGILARERAGADRNRNRNRNPNRNSNPNPNPNRNGETRRWSKPKVKRVVGSLSSSSAAAAITASASSSSSPSSASAASASSLSLGRRNTRGDSMALTGNGNRNGNGNGNGSGSGAAGASTLVEKEKRGDTRSAGRRSLRASPIPESKPSSSTTMEMSGATDPTPPSAACAPAEVTTAQGFTTGQDFIPFDFSDPEGEEEEEEEEVVEILPAPSPGKGKGKGRERVDRDTRGGQNGLKRSAAEMEEEDGYSNKKQRTDASSRLTPWITDVEWGDCRNLAELCVSCFFGYGKKYVLMQSFFFCLRQIAPRS